MKVPIFNDRMNDGLKGDFLKLAYYGKLLGCYVALIALTVFMACGEDKPAESPTVTPTDTPVPTATAVAVANQCPTTEPPEPWELLEPEFPGSREFLIRTNVDRGELLLPYLDRSVQQDEYALTFTFQRSFEFPENPDQDHVEMQRSVIRTDGNITLAELLEYEDADDQGSSGFSTGKPGSQIIMDGYRSYGRFGATEKWVDITELTACAGYSGGIGQTSEESPIEQALFDAGSSRILATFGIFDEESISEYAEGADMSPLMDFEVESSNSDQIVIAHRVHLSFEEEIAGLVEGSQTNQDVVFTIDAGSGLVAHVLDSQVQESTGSYASVDTFILEYEIDYSLQDLVFPEPGDLSVETDPEKIAAFIELFDE